MADVIQFDDGEINYVRSQLGKAREMLAAGIPCDPKDMGLLRCLATIDALRFELHHARDLFQSARETNKRICESSKEDAVSVTSWFAELTKLRAENATLRRGFGELEALLDDEKYIRGHEYKSLEEDLARLGDAAGALLDALPLCDVADCKATAAHHCVDAAGDSSLRCAEHLMGPSAPWNEPPTALTTTKPAETLRRILAEIGGKP